MLGIFRFIFALVVCLAVMFGIIYFVAMGHTLMNLVNAYALYQVPVNSRAEVAVFWSNVKFAITDYLIRPYSLAVSGPPAQTFVPIAALSLAGFISGLISKHPFRAIIIGIICSILVVIGFFAWSIAAPLSWSSIFGIITGVSGWDYVLLFVLPAFTGMIGGLITRDWSRF